MALTPASWAVFADADPDLARFGEQRLSRQIAYLATIRINGAPRLHPVMTHISEGVCFVYMEPTSPKVGDLKRDQRYALHCSVEDADGGNGEFGIRGSAVQIEDIYKRARLIEAARAEGFQPKDHYVLFELKIETALSTTYDQDGIPRRKIWRSESI
jgi:hypothetical protein